MKNSIWNAALLAFWLTSCNTIASPCLPNTNSTEFEYIIVGSGPGGGPLASNLARQGYSVLLLEAGEDHGDTDLQRVPQFAAANSEDPTMSWEFFVSHYSDPVQAQRDSKFTWRTPNGTFHVGYDPPPPEDSEPLGIFYPRVGTLGGCANHNAMNVVAPPDSDWATLARVTGDDAFGPENMRRLLVRLESNQVVPNGTAGHGFDGYLATNRNDINLITPQTGLLEVIRTAMVDAGDAPANVTIEEVVELLQRDQNRLDSNRYQRHSLFQIPVHIDAQRRRSSAQTYIYETRDAQNADGGQAYPLTIRTNAFVTRILFDPDTLKTSPRAIGVNFLEGVAMYSADRRYNVSDPGVSHNVYATREVIIAGGVFNTPQILKLSGIGPREELESFDIPVLVDLPAVGTNMQDNYEGGVHVLAAQDFHSVYANCTRSQEGDPCLEQWRNEFSGPYGQGSAAVGMVMRSSYSENEDADLFFFGGAGGAFLGHYPGFSRAVYPPSTFFWSVVKMQTQNRAGTVTLRSNNPRDTPEIAFNHFAQGREHDLNAMAEGVDFVRRVFENVPEPYGPFEWILPQPNQTAQESILNEVFSHHATSTCVMGRLANSGNITNTDLNRNTTYPNTNDNGNNRTISSCVDPQFRVHGTENLRVVDGSVFPRIPGAFPVLATFMISEKATDDILETARLTPKPRM